MTQDYEQILLSSGIPVKVIVQQVNHFHLHWHEYSELLYLVKGSINIHVSGETYTVREGQFTLINGTEIHGINRTDEGNLIIVVQFDERFFHLVPDLKGLQFRRSLFVQDQEKTPYLFDHITNLLKRIVWEYNKQPKGYRYQLTSLLYEILAEFIRRDYFVEKEVKASNQDDIHERIMTILSYINAHYMEDISLKTIAENEHISYYYLSRMFKEITSISFREYLMTIRLKKAQEALEKGKSSILDIALSNGFSNSKSFFEAFRKTYQMTPGEYRRQFQLQAQKRVQPMRFAAGNENNLMYLSVDSTADTKLHLNHRHNPLSTSNALNDTCRQVSDNFAETIDYFLQRLKHFVFETALPNLFPNLLNRIHFRSIWWNVRNSDIGRNLQTFRCVPSGTITYQQDYLIRIGVG